MAEKDKVPFRETIKGRFLFRGNSSSKLDLFESSHYSIRKELLPPPYETGCFSYSKLHFTSSIECLERCVVHKSFQKWGAIPDICLVPTNEVDYKFVPIVNYTKYLAELDEIRLSCRPSCPNTTCEDTQILASIRFLGNESKYSSALQLGKT